MRAGGEVAHQRRRLGLRREAAGMGDHQAAHHRVDAEGEDHRGDAQVGDAEAVEEADQRGRRRGRSGSPRAPPTVVAIIAAAVIVQGTERSMWPSRITIIMPAATMPRKEPICSCCSR